MKKFTDFIADMNSKSGESILVITGKEVDVYRAMLDYLAEKIEEQGEAIALRSYFMQNRV